MNTSENFHYFKRTRKLLQGLLSVVVLLLFLSVLSEYAVREGLGKTQLSRYKQWRAASAPCHGSYLRNICIHGTRDLPRLQSMQKLYLNKLFVDYEPYVYHCLEQRHFERTRAQYTHTALQTNLNWDAIKNMTIVHHHLWSYGHWVSYCNAGERCRIIREYIACGYIQTSHICVPIRALILNVVTFRPATYVGL